MSTYSADEFPSWLWGPAQFEFGVSTYQNQGTSLWRLYWKKRDDPSNIVYVVGNAAFQTSTGGSLRLVQRYYFSELFDYCSNYVLVADFVDQGQTVSTQWDPTDVLEETAGFNYNLLLADMVNALLYTQTYPCYAQRVAIKKKSTGTPSTTIDFRIAFNMINVPYLFPEIWYVIHRQNLYSNPYALETQLGTDGTRFGPSIPGSNSGIYQLSFVEPKLDVFKHVPVLSQISHFFTFQGNLIYSDRIRNGAAMGAFLAWCTGIRSWGATRTYVNGPYQFIPRLSLFPSRTYGTIPYQNQTQYPFYILKCYLNGPSDCHYTVWYKNTLYVRNQQAMNYVYFQGGNGSDGTTWSYIPGPVTFVFFKVDSAGIAESFVSKPVQYDLATLVQSAYSNQNTSYSVSFTVNTTIQSQMPNMTMTLECLYSNGQVPIQPPDPEPTPSPDPPVPKPTPTPVTDYNSMREDISLRQEIAVDNTVNRLERYPRITNVVDIPPFVMNQKIGIKGIPLAQTEEAKQQIWRPDTHYQQTLNHFTAVIKELNNLKTREPVLYDQLDHRTVRSAADIQSLLSQSKLEKHYPALMNPNLHLTLNYGLGQNNIMPLYNSDELKKAANNYPKFNETVPLNDRPYYTQTHTGTYLDKYGLPYNAFNNTLGTDGLYFSSINNPEFKLPDNFFTLPTEKMLKEADLLDKTSSSAKLVPESTSFMQQWSVAMGAGGIVASMIGFPVLPILAISGIGGILLDMSRAEDPFLLVNSPYQFFHSVKKDGVTQNILRLTNLVAPFSGKVLPHIVTSQNINRLVATGNIVKSAWSYIDATDQKSQVALSVADMVGLDPTVSQAIMIGQLMDSSGFKVLPQGEYTNNLIAASKLAESVTGIQLDMQQYMSVGQWRDLAYKTYLGYSMLTNPHLGAVGVGMASIKLAETAGIVNGGLDIIQHNVHRGFALAINQLAGTTVLSPPSMQQKENILKAEAVQEKVLNSIEEIKQKLISPSSVQNTMRSAINSLDSIVMDQLINQPNQESNFVAASLLGNIIKLAATSKNVDTSALKNDLQSFSLALYSQDTKALNSLLNQYSYVDPSGELRLKLKQLPSSIRPYKGPPPPVTPFETLLRESIEYEPLFVEKTTEKLFFSNQLYTELHQGTLDYIKKFALVAASNLALYGASNMIDKYGPDSYTNVIRRGDVQRVPNNQVIKAKKIAKGFLLGTSIVGTWQNFGENIKDLAYGVRGTFDKLSEITSTWQSIRQKKESKPSYHVPLRNQTNVSDAIQQIQTEVGYNLTPKQREIIEEAVNASEEIVQNNTSDFTNKTKADPATSSWYQLLTYAQDYVSNNTKKIAATVGVAGVGAFLYDQYNKRTQKEADKVQQQILTDPIIYEMAQQHAAKHLTIQQGLKLWAAGVVSAHKTDAQTQKILLNPTKGDTSEGRRQLIDALHKHIHSITKISNSENKVVQTSIIKSISSFLELGLNHALLDKNQKSIQFFHTLKSIVDPVTRDETYIQDQFIFYCKGGSYQTLQTTSLNEKRLSEYDALHYVTRHPHMLNDFVERVLKNNIQRNLSKLGGEYIQDRFRPDYLPKPNVQQIRPLEDVILPRPKKDYNHKIRAVLPQKLSVLHQRPQSEYYINTQFANKRRKF